MHTKSKKVLLLAMPFAGTAIPSIQLPLLAGYLQERGITCHTNHLYLKAADFYGLINYNCLIYPPNDSYTAQMVFSKFVFADHWNANRHKFIEYFNKSISKNKKIDEQFTFDVYVQKTENFYHWVINTIDWRRYDIIGFTLNYGQLLPSLAIAKKIKDIDSTKKIVFGGSRTVYPLGMKVLEAFDYIDFIVTGDGEEPLYQLAANNIPYEDVPNLQFRNNDNVLYSQKEYRADLNCLPILSFNQFFTELHATSPDINQYFSYFGKLPIEISRGCWWNKCTFCNQKIQQPCYREKTVEKIIEEIQFLSKTYHILDFQLLGETILKNNYRTLLEEIQQLNKDLTFVAEIRAGQLNSIDYSLLKNAGFTIIQTGIETFSPQYIRKMNKGVRVIDNIAVLKYCKEHDIINAYNIVVNYPNEDLIDFKETKDNIQFFEQFIDPPQLSYLRIGFGCDIYENKTNYGIKSLEYTDIDKVLFPKSILEKNFMFFFNFIRKEDCCDNKWQQLIDKWRKEREQREHEAATKKTLIDKLVLYYVDGQNFLKIYDKRDPEHIRIFELDNTERCIFLACNDVISFDELQALFPTIPEYQLAAVLHTFEKNGLVYREDQFYLSLPLRCQKNKLYSENSAFGLETQTSGILRVL